MTKITRLRKYETRTFYPEAKFNAQYAMVVRAGDLIFLRGQTGFDFDGVFHGVGDAAAQAENACKCVKILLEEAGASVNNICKLTIYLTDPRYREEVYAVIARHFKGVYPCGTGVVVQALATPEMLVEIDVFAVA